MSAWSRQLYDEQAIEGLPTSTLLDGDATWNQSYFVAQVRQFRVCCRFFRMSHRALYPFEVCNAAGEEREFVVTAWRGAAEADRAVPPRGGGQGRTVMERPGKVERLGIVASAKVPMPAGAGEGSPSQPVARSRSQVAVVGRLRSASASQTGNALIHASPRAWTVELWAWLERVGDGRGEVIKLRHRFGTAAARRHPAMMVSARGEAARRLSALYAA